ncbi:MAG: hypothetical protein IPH69_03730 [Bacteroidales bacterium]|nr:hypothetical protein [Bacteroidales bacterium]
MVINLNNSSDNVTNINTGSSNGNVTIGNPLSSLYLKKFTTAGVLHNAADGLISSSLVSLTADVNGILPVPNGGTGINDITTNNLIYGNGTSPVNLLAPGVTTGMILTTTGSGAPGWLTLATLPSTSGILQIGNGGTGTNTVPVQGGVIYGSSATAYGTTCRISGSGITV